MRKPTLMTYLVLLVFLITLVPRPAESITLGGIPIGAKVPTLAINYAFIHNGKLLESGEVLDPIRFEHVGYTTCAPYIVFHVWPNTSTILYRGLLGTKAYLADLDTQRIKMNIETNVSIADMMPYDDKILIMHAVVGAYSVLDLDGQLITSYRVVSNTLGDDFLVQSLVPTGSGDVVALAKIYNGSETIFVLLRYDPVTMAVAWAYELGFTPYGMHRVGDSVVLVGMYGGRYLEPAIVRVGFDSTILAQVAIENLWSVVVSATDSRYLYLMVRDSLFNNILIKVDLSTMSVLWAKKEEGIFYASTGSLLNYDDKYLIFVSPYLYINGNRNYAFIRISKDGYPFTENEQAPTVSINAMTPIDFSITTTAYSVSATVSPGTGSCRIVDLPPEPLERIVAYEGVEVWGEKNTMVVKFGDETIRIRPDSRATTDLFLNISGYEAFLGHLAKLPGYGVVLSTAPIETVTTGRKWINITLTSKGMIYLATGCKIKKVLIDGTETEAQKLDDLLVVDPSNINILIDYVALGGTAVNDETLKSTVSVALLSLTALIISRVIRT